MARLMIVLTREEVQKSIPYALICETMCGSKWNTMKRKRLWAQQFTEKEREACSALGVQARKWHVKTGVPEEVTMTAETRDLWNKLAAFCASL